MEMPNLIEIQQNSYDWFLKEGLKETFQEVSPIQDFTGNLILNLLTTLWGNQSMMLKNVRKEMLLTHPLARKS